MPLTADERKARMKATRGLQRKVARQLGVSEQHISLVVAGERDGSDRVQLAVAKALRLPVDEVFPRETAIVAA
jgi:transcriptional regulator with XRE-family HTH domain